MPTLPQAPQVPGGNLVLYAGGAACGLIVLLLLVVVFVFRGKKAPSGEAALMEKLAGYPPPPAGDARVSVQNEPARVRLVVIAPAGKRNLGEPEAVLDQILRGLGKAARADKARIRVWPPQLSHKGFPNTFFRVTHRPEPEGRPSRWVLMAGTARVGGQPVLLGLALLTEEPTRLGLMEVEESEWGDFLQVER
jgi:hypothetical protein